MLCGKVLPFAAKHWLLKSDSFHPTKPQKHEMSPNYVNTWLKFGDADGPRLTRMARL